MCRKSGPGQVVEVVLWTYVWVEGIEPPNNLAQRSLRAGHYESVRPISLSVLLHQIHTLAAEKTAARGVGRLSSHTPHTPDLFTLQTRNGLLAHRTQCVEGTHRLRLDALIQRARTRRYFER